MRIALISCTSKKKTYKCRASELYSESPRFSLSYEYAKKNCDKVYILSAKYGLISEDEVIEPYNETLKDKSTIERKEWSSKVLRDLDNKHSLEKDEFLILAGKAYNQYLLPYIKNYKLPLQGKSLGNWIPELRALNEKSDCKIGKDNCYIINELFNKMPRMYWNDIDKLPFNDGIYVMFEKGEKYFTMDRIVRIGTHNGDGRLKKRLKNHFIGKNADGSIFRKNIGRAFLHKVKDPYEPIWELNTSKVQVREANVNVINLQKEEFIEDTITEYLKNNISFVCFYVNTKVERLRLEEALISTLNQSNNFTSSVNWLGLSHPKEEIVNSKLWNIQGLKGVPLTESEIARIEELIENQNYIKDGFNSNDHINNKKKSSKIIIQSIKNDVDNVKVSTNQIRAYIEKILNEAKEAGFDYIDIISGDIHKRMNLKNKMPSVCSAMYQLVKEKDVILHKTPSGKSSTIKIRYYVT